MADIFDSPGLRASNVPLPRPTGRLILIADEVGPGAFAIDFQSTMHPAKSAMVALNLFKMASAAVEDEMQRREILNQFEEISGIVTGRKPSESAPIMAQHGLRVCEHDYDAIHGICLKCGRAK